MNHFCKVEISKYYEWSNGLENEILIITWALSSGQAIYKLWSCVSSALKYSCNVLPVESISSPQICLD